MVDEEVAFRWLRLYPGRRLEEHLADPHEAAVEMLVNTPGKIEELRKRLSDVSWFMKSLSEPIARLANKQDECTGRFWEGRFKAQKIVDEAGLLACSMYVDLNPVRAAMAECPGDSQYTSACDRIQGSQGGSQVAAATELPSEVAKDDELKALEATSARAEQSGDERSARRMKRQVQKAMQGLKERHAEHVRRVRRDAWLAPIELNECGRPGAKVHRAGLRASDKGFLSMGLSDYLKLLDWTGRQSQQGKRGRVPKSLRPVLQRLGIESSMWCDLVWNFQRYFGRSRAAGRPESLKAEAQKCHRCWIPGQRLAAECFA